MKMRVEQDGHTRVLGAQKSCSEVHAWEVILKINFQEHVQLKKQRWRKKNNSAGVHWWFRALFYIFFTLMTIEKKRQCWSLDVGSELMLKLTKAAFIWILLQVHISLKIDGVFFAVRKDSEKHPFHKLLNVTVE